MIFDILRLREASRGLFVLLFSQKSLDVKKVRLAETLANIYVKLVMNEREKGLSGAAYECGEKLLLLYLTMIIVPLSWKSCFRLSMLLRNKSRVLTFSRMPSSYCEVIVERMVTEK